MRQGPLCDSRAMCLAPPGGKVAVSLSSLMPEMPAPSGGCVNARTVAAAYLNRPRLSVCIIRLVALVWILILGQSSFAGSYSPRHKARPHQRPILASAVRIASHSHVCPACERPENRSAVSPCECLLESLVTGFLDNPNDDETSDDPNDDDDAWEGLDADDSTDVPTDVCFQDAVRYLTDLELGSTPAWTETLTSSPFLAPQRLRC